MSDFDELSLPPRRPLPREVRDRLRATVLRRPQVRPAGNRMALVVAAGVAVLAMGATVLTQVVAGSHELGATGPTAAVDGTPPPLDMAAAKANLNRCWSALAKTPSVHAVPGEPDWQPMFAVTWDGVTVTAVRTQDEALFCQTTRTTVTVSNPNAEPVYVAGSRTAARLASTAGVVAGVLDPAWRQLTLAGTGRTGAAIGGPSYHQDGMFVVFIGVTGPGTRYRVTPTGSPAATHSTLDLPAAPDALVAVVDRPDPPADRTSPAGRFLGDCVARTDWAVPDPDSWRPMEMMTVGNTSLVLARSASSTAVCSAVDQHATNALIPIKYMFQLTGMFTPDKPLWTMFDEVVTSDSPAEDWVALGAVRPDVASGEVILPIGRSIPIEIENNTFAVQYAPPDYLRPWRLVTVVLRDKTGHELYHAPVQVGP